MIPIQYSIPISRIQHDKIGNAGDSELRQVFAGKEQIDCVLQISATNGVDRFGRGKYTLDRFRMYKINIDRMVPVVFHV